MPNFLIHPFLLQLPLAQAGQLLLVVGVSFVLITLLCSIYRFNKMMELSEDELSTPQELDNFFVVQVTRYFSKIHRESSGFGLLIIQIQTDAPDQQEAQKEVLNYLKGTSRGIFDTVCLYRTDCIALIVDTEEDKVNAIITRIVQELHANIETLPITALRAGTSSFPTNGHSSQAIINSATASLESASFDMLSPLHIVNTEDPDSSEEASKETDEIETEHIDSSIDKLTGVLKPKVIASYMRKYLAELRQKKGFATLLCVGINRIDQITDLQGEEAADAVTAQVSQLMQKLTRDDDLIGRYYGNDFLVLAPCPLDQGEMLAIRLREAVQKEIILFNGRRIKTSVSIGIAAHPEHGRTLRDLFNGAFAAFETLREWETSSCLTFDPSKHSKKVRYDSSKT